MSSEEQSKIGTHVHVTAGAIRRKVEDIAANFTSKGTIRGNEIEVTHKFLVPFTALRKNAADELWFEPTRVDADALPAEDTIPADLRPEDISSDKIHSIILDRLKEADLHHIDLEVRSTAHPEAWQVEIKQRHEISNLPPRSRTAFQAIRNENKIEAKAALDRLQHENLRFRVHK